MEAEDPTVANPDDCRLVVGSSRNATKAASPVVVTVDSPNVHFETVCRCGHGRPSLIDVETGEAGLLEELHAKERRQKLMVLILTAACVVNLAVTGIGIAYLRLHFAQEDILAVEEPPSEVGHARQQHESGTSLYSHIKALIANKRRARMRTSTTQTSTTPSYRRMHKRRTRWTSRFHFPHFARLRRTTTSAEPMFFRLPIGYTLA